MKYRVKEIKSSGKATVYYAQRKNFFGYWVMIKRKDFTGTSCTANDLLTE